MSVNAPVVLLATRHTDLREFSAMKLAIAGIHVECAETGEDALQRAQALRPDVLVSTHRLPDFDGLVLRARLRSHPATSTIPMLIVHGAPRAWLQAIDIAMTLVERGRTKTQEPALQSSAPVVLN